MQCNMVQPLVSIIMPVFNAADTLHTSLNSIKDQTYPAIELVLIDDCSSDISLLELGLFKDAVLSYPERIVKIIKHEYNQGVAATRNTGLDYATGEYIYYVDADDWIEPETISLLVQAAEQTDADIVGCNWFLSFQKNERKMHQPAFSTAMEGLTGILNGSMRWNLWLFLCRRSLYEQNYIRFLPGKDMGEDLMVMCKLFTCAKKVTYVDQRLYHYMQVNENSLTKLYSEKHIRQVTRNVAEVESFFRKSRYAGQLGNGISFLKLNIKLPLLISADKVRYRQWINWFPEANKYIMQNKNQAFRTRLVQVCAVNKQFWLVQLYYWLVIRLVYGILYK